MNVIAGARPPLTSWPLRRAWLTGGFGLGISIMVNFLVPLRAVEVGASLGVVGLIVGVGSIIPAILGAPIGALSDRFGPRRVFRFATAGAALTTGGMAFATHWGVLLAGMVVFGPFRAAAWASSQSYITSIGGPADRARNTSRFSFTTAATRAFNPLMIGAAAEVFGLRSSFFVIAGYGALYFLIASSLADPDPNPIEPTDSEPSAGGRSDALNLLRRPGIQVALLLSFARVWAASVLVAFYPLLLIERGVSTAVAGSVISANAAVGMVATLLVPRLSRRFSMEILTAAGLGLGAIGFGIIPFMTGTAAAYIPSALVGVGEGLSLPLLIAMVSEAAGPQLRGLAIGIRISVNQLAQVSAALLMGAVVGAIGLAAGIPIAGATTAAVTLTATARHVSTDRSRRASQSRAS